MNKKIWLGLAAALIVAVALSLIALPRGAEWTTDSPEALVEFTAAVDAQMKVYHNEVQAHLERALELDPEFVIAKLFLADKAKMNDDGERALRLWNDVMAADRSKLTDRERVIIERARAIQEKRYEDADLMLDDYLAEHPNDPFLLHRKALSLWMSGDFEEAERLNRRLIEIAPNWVIAYNQLGYIAMSQGRFVEAEEYFTSYRFVAPDQANPHDSLGELYIILGRYDDAEISLYNSIEIKPDFWAAYDHLAMARMMVNDFVGAEQALAMAEAAGDVPDYWKTGIACIIRIAELARNEQYREVLAVREENPECFKGHSEGHADVTVHRAACLLGEWEIADAIEERFSEMIAEIESGEIKGEFANALGVLAHLQGVRLATEGDLVGAIERFRQADDNMTYIQAGNGLFKLYNRLFLVETFFAAGEDAQAHKLLSQVRSVNPRMVEDFEEQGLKVLGLERE
jgi:tetratricopeptide (TPR) repeat protein